MKWEYRVSTKAPDITVFDMESYLNSFGEEGWELVSFSPGQSQYAIFKRPQYHSKRISNINNAVLREELERLRDEACQGCMDGLPLAPGPFGDSHRHHTMSILHPCNSIVIRSRLKELDSSSQEE